MAPAGPSRSRAPSRSSTTPHRSPRRTRDCLSWDSPPTPIIGFPGPRSQGRRSLPGPPLGPASGRAWPRVTTSTSSGARGRADAPAGDDVGHDPHPMTLGSRRPRAEGEPLVLGSSISDASISEAVPRRRTLQPPWRPASMPSTSKLTGRPSSTARPNLLPTSVRKTTVSPSRRKFTGTTIGAASGSATAIRPIGWRAISAKHSSRGSSSIGGPASGQGLISSVHEILLRSRRPTTGLRRPETMSSEMQTKRSVSSPAQSAAGRRRLARGPMVRRCGGRSR